MRTYELTVAAFEDDDEINETFPTEKLALEGYNRVYLDPDKFIYKELCYYSSNDCFDVSTTIVEQFA